MSLEPALDGLSLVSLPEDGLDRVSHQLERDGTAELVRRVDGDATVVLLSTGEGGMASTLWRSAGLAGRAIIGIPSKIRLYSSNLRKFIQYFNFI